MNIFESLNDKQIEAVKAIEGPILILAGAGSGKTKTLTHRIAHLLAININPENILAVTFTNKAAEEMRNRIKKILEIEKSELRIANLFVGTFHSLGVKILRQEIENLGYNTLEDLNKMSAPLAAQKREHLNAKGGQNAPTKYKNNFVIYDEDDMFSLVKSIRAELNFPQDKYKAGTLLNIISKAKSELKNFEETIADIDEMYRSRILHFCEIYNQRMLAANAVDFDDLIILPIKIFQKFPEILKKYQNQYRHILVDEYQDTNHAQYTLINLLAQKNKNIFAIGDPDQAIYGWRHADFRNILNFERDYPNAKVIKLEENYRSTKNILAAAHEIISKNVERKEKKLWTSNPPGNPIEVVEASNEREEAEFIINKILQLNKNLETDLDKIVVMYRTNAQSRVLEEACLYANLPYRVIGAVKFYQRKEIKDILAYLRLIQNSKDEISEKRIIDVMGKRRFADFRTDLPELKKQTKFLPPSELIKNIIKKTNYYDYLNQKFSGTDSEGESEAESRIKNVRELIGLASKYDPVSLEQKEWGVEQVLSDFLAETVLMQENRDNNNSKKLNLMTLHAAKGLEFDAVFIAGCEENFMPHSRSAFSLSELEEERRLCYVGFTRAKKYLWILFARERSLWGEKGENLPSRFIMEIPEHLVKFQSLVDGYNLPEIELD